VKYAVIGAGSARIDFNLHLWCVPKRVHRVSLSGLYACGLTPKETDDASVLIVVRLVQRAARSELLQRRAAMAEFAQRLGALSAPDRLETSERLRHRSFEIGQSTLPFGDAASLG
jgi:hypothetical protein